MTKFTPEQITDYREFFTILANIRRRHALKGNEIRAGPTGKETHPV